MRPVPVPRAFVPDEIYDTVAASRVKPSLNHSIARKERRGGGRAARDAPRQVAAVVVGEMSGSNGLAVYARYFPCLFSITPRKAAVRRRWNMRGNDKRTALGIMENCAFDSGDLFRATDAKSYTSAGTTTETPADFPRDSRNR